MQTCEAKFKYFLLYFQITELELKKKVEIYLEKTINFTSVRISLLINSTLSHWVSMEHLQKSEILFSSSPQSWYLLNDFRRRHEFSSEASAGGRYFVLSVSGGKWSVMIQGAYSRPLLTPPPSVKLFCLSLWPQSYSTNTLSNSRLALPGNLWCAL